jgi:hypothetical protein
VSASWDQPDFSDPRFSIEAVCEAEVCRYPGCDRLAEYLVAYTMRRDRWTYEYGCGYCDEHLPQEARGHARVIAPNRTVDGSV